MRAARSDPFQRGSASHFAPGRMNAVTRNWRYHRGMQRLVAYLQLCRFAAVFTAMADICLGYLLAHPAGIVSPRDFTLLLTASSCLYLAGMVLNDVFDREIDAAQRPNRPIPSGRVSLRAAATLGGVLLAAGFGAACAVGVQSAIVAGILVAAILLYDGVLKATPLRSEEHTSE